MDPDKTFERFINSVCDEDFAQAEESLENLLEWVVKGGFPPNFPKAKVPTSFIVNIKKLIFISSWGLGGCVNS